MTLIADFYPLNRGEMRNAAFRQKITRDSILAMYAAAGIAEADAKFDMYDFIDDPILVGAMNKGTGGFLGNMAWDNAALRTGDGWYCAPEIAGANGFGMTNDGGVSGHYGSVISHTGNMLDSCTKATFTFKIKPSSDGEGNQGRIISKRDASNISYSIYMQNTNDLLLLVTTNLGLSSWNFTLANLPIGFWSSVTIVLDASAANDGVLYVNGNPVQGIDIGFTSIVDAGPILYILDMYNNTRAFDGNLGYLGIYPDLAMTEAQARSLVELRGLFQPTAANQPLLHTPGTFGVPDYDFDGVADPNTDCLYSYQTEPIKTPAGTILMWARLTANTLPYTLLALQTPLSAGAGTFQQLALINYGARVNDPMTLFAGDAALGILDDFEYAASEIVYKPIFHGLSSDGSQTSAYVNGSSSPITVRIGSNVGRWFDMITEPSVLSLGVMRRDILLNGWVGTISKLRIYDRALAPLEIEQIYQRNGGGPGQRFYPDK